MNRACPHCGADNAGDASFCAQCGKALPAVAPSGPHIVAEAGQASTAAGREVQVGELERKSRKAFGLLLVVAILQGLMVFAVPWLLEGEADKLREQGMLIDEAKLASLVTTTRVVVGLVAVVFLGLAFWARRNPLPAAIAGLVVFVTLHVIDAVVDPSALSRGVVLKVIVVVGLISAIRAGIDHRRIAAQAGPAPR